jgi:hypothetical protein
VVAVALSLWLGWSRETAMLREESAAREAKLQNGVAAERDKGIEKMRGLALEHSKLMVKSKMQEALLERLGAKVTSPPTQTNRPD